MSAIRVTKMLEGLVAQLQRMGYSNAITAQGVLTASRWLGRGTVDGRDAIVIDIDAAAWVTANRRAIIVAVPAGDSMPAAMRTQSHASGMTIDGSVAFYVYLESPANHTGNHAQFVRRLEQALVGQLSGPCQFYFTANGVEPTVNGVNGAVATAANTDGGLLLPGFLAYPGGV